jgi:hypothetical protein
LHERDDLWLPQLETGFEDRILAFDQPVSRVWGHMTAQAETQGESIATANLNADD